MGRMALIWDVWKSPTTAHGEQFVIEGGVTMTPELHAGIKRLAY